MTFQIFLVCLFIGSFAGYLTGVFVKGFGFGKPGNLVVGIFGAVAASVLLPRLDVLTLTDLGSQVVSATIGAVLTLFTLGLLRRSM